MKIAISMWSYVKECKSKGLAVDEFIELAKASGGEGVELLDFFFHDVLQDSETAKAACRAFKMPCAIFSVSQNFALPNAENRVAALGTIHMGVNEAKRLGAGVVRVFAGNPSPDVSFDSALEWIVDGLAEASKYAAEHGVLLALENHGALAGRSDQVKNIIERVRAKSGVNALGSNPDTANFLLVNQIPHEAVAEVAPYANMVHLKDFKLAPKDFAGFSYRALNGDKYMGVPLGQGDVQLGKCIAALRDAKYDGWLSIEFEGEQSGITAVEECVKVAKSLIA